MLGPVRTGPDPFRSEASGISQASGECRVKSLRVAQQRVLLPYGARFPGSARRLPLTRPVTEFS